MTEDQTPSCSIYKGNRKEFTYLFVERADDFERVPESLIGLLGELTHVMDLELGPDRILANSDIDEVRRGLTENGYYLQMPPDDKPDDEYFS